jgi:two-component system, cell cycle sensor histidine kinase and response regulator CckA
MPDGGMIRIIAEKCTVENENALPLRAGRYIRFSIADKGHGIPPENLDKIFDPFFTTKPKGNGLGLATTFTIIHKHDGHIAVNSSVGDGSIFTIYLPAANEAIDQNRTEDEKSFTGEGKILLMDDEDLVLEVGGEILKHLGFEVAYAHDGVEAVESYVGALASDRPFDIVIMDLTVPGGIGGKEAVKHLAQIDPCLRAIVSSGYSNDPVMADFRQHGFNGVILKPYRVEEIKQVLQQVLERPSGQTGGTD